MKNIILCDIDGTVANNEHRQHYLLGEKDWDGFFSKLSDDLPIHNVIEFVKNEHSKGMEIIFLTGRPQRYKYSTVSWLKDYFNFDFKIYMRPDGNQNNKIKVKRKIFIENFKSEDIALVLDNDEDLLKMWREMKLPVLDANSMY